MKLTRFLLLVSLCLWTLGVNKIVAKDGPSQKKFNASTKKTVATLLATEKREALLQLSPRVEQAILKAVNGSQIAYISQIMMKTDRGTCLLFLDVGYVPKSEKAMESTILNGLAVIVDQHGALSVYATDESLYSQMDLFREWLRETPLPVGKGFTKLLGPEPLAKIEE